MDIGYTSEESVVQLATYPMSILPFICANWIVFGQLIRTHLFLALDSLSPKKSDVPEPEVSSEKKNKTQKTKSTQKFVGGCFWESFTFQGKGGMVDANFLPFSFCHEASCEV